MDEVDLTVKQAAQALGLEYGTVLKYCSGKRKKFPHAHLLHGSRKLGYVIPSGDVLAYARSQSAVATRRTEEIIKEAAAAQGFLDQAS